jgi:hypothetical protein
LDDLYFFPVLLLPQTLRCFGSILIQQVWTILNLHLSLRLPQTLQRLQANAFHSILFSIIFYFCHRRFTALGCAKSLYFFFFFLLFFTFATDASALWAAPKIVLLSFYFLFYFCHRSVASTLIKQ